MSSFGLLLISQVIKYLLSEENIKLFVDELLQALGLKISETTKQAISDLKDCTDAEELQDQLEYVGKQLEVDGVEPEKYANVLLNKVSFQV